MLGVAATGCGDDEHGEAAGGTLALSAGMVPDDPAVDLTPSSDGGRREVVMIGDSITVASAPLIVADAAGRGIEVAVHAEVGRRIAVGGDPPAGTDVLADLLADADPTVVVVALGTNDIGQYATAEEYAGQIDELLDLLPDAVPLVWINTYLSSSPQRSQLFNDALSASLGERGRASIGRWSVIARQDGVLRDGIHPSDDGARRFAELVVDEIANWVG